MFELVSPLPAAEIPAQDNPVDPVRKRSRTTKRLGSLRVPCPTASALQAAPVAVAAPIPTPSSSKKGVDAHADAQADPDAKLKPDALSWPDVSDPVTSDGDSASIISDAELEEACRTMSDDSSSGISDAELEEACKMLMDPW